MNAPEFPLRVIYDDGEVVTIDTPDDLFSHFTSVDSLDPAARLWIRDTDDRTVRLVMRNGIVEKLEIA